MTAREEIYAGFAQSLLDDVVHASDPSPEKAVDILVAIRKVTNRNPVTLEILQKTKIGRCLAKTVKVCRTRKRLKINDDDWDKALKYSKALVDEFKEIVGYVEKSAPRTRKIAKKDVNDAGGPSPVAVASSAAAGGKKPAASGKKVGRPVSNRSKAAKRAWETRRRNGTASAKNDAGGGKRARKQRRRGGECDDPRLPAGRTRSSPRKNVKKAADGGGPSKTNGEAKPPPAPRTTSTNDNNLEGGCARKPSPVSVLKTAEEDAAAPVMEFNFAADGESAANGKVKSLAEEDGSMTMDSKDGESAVDGKTKISVEENGSMTMDSKDGESAGNGKAKLSAEEDGSMAMDSKDGDSGDSTESKGEDVRSSDDTLVANGSSPKRVSIPPSLYKVCHRVYARDDATGLLYPAFIRKVMWGPISTQVTMGFCSPLVDGESIGDSAGNEEKEVEEDEEDEDARRSDPQHNCYHYYVHYMGWGVKWDRWVEEAYLYEDSASTEALAKLLAKEYKKVKPKKKGQKMSIVQIRKWMKQISELEADHERLEKEARSGGGPDQESGEGGDTSKERMDQESEKGGNTGKEEDMKMSEKGQSDAKKIESNETPKENLADDTAKVEEAKETESNRKRKAEPNKPLNEETLQKQAQLRESGLQMKRKRSVSERLTLPFNLKTVLVQEWEIITQCDMVHNLPSQVSVKDVLDRYLENKLAPLKEKQEEEDKTSDDMGATEGESDKIDEASSGNEKTKSSVLGKEWIDMVENILLFFDQCLPVHLLFAEERSQYNSLRRQILAQKRNSAARAASISADDGSNSAAKGKESVEILVDSIGDKQPCNTQSAATGNSSIVTASESSVSSNSLKSPPPNFLPTRMSEIYGCEHLLRLLVRLPAIVAASPAIGEMESRRIFTKLGDLVRYLQKHQSQIFCSSFGRLSVGANRSSKKSGGK